MEVKVSPEVLRGLEAVRESGKTNMFNARAVITLAREEGFHETADWVEANKELYLEGFFNGFTA